MEHTFDNVASFKLSTRAYNCLMRNGIDTVEKLKNLTEEDIRGMRNVGIKTAEEIMIRARSADIEFYPEPDYSDVRAELDALKQNRKIKASVYQKAIKAIRIAEAFTNLMCIVEE